MATEANSGAQYKELRRYPTPLPFSCTEKPAIVRLSCPFSISCSVMSSECGFVLRVNMSIISISSLVTYKTEAATNFAVNLSGHF